MWRRGGGGGADPVTTRQRNPGEYSAKMGERGGEIGGAGADQVLSMLGQITFS